MTDRDVIDMAQRCVEEIERLRQRVEKLAPKADAYDAITCILGLLPQPPQGYEEDVLWRLRKQIEELKSASAPAVAADA